jgi:beta-glucosidase/6-phospho-beta-glucosidase/beta-galactosidase
VSNSRLKDLFGYWITINEPVASIVGVGYIAGLSPPGFFLEGKRAKLALPKNTEKVTISSSYV